MNLECTKSSSAAYPSYLEADTPLIGNCPTQWHEEALLIVESRSCIPLSPAAIDARPQRINDRPCAILFPIMCWMVVAPLSDRYHE